MHRNNRMVTYIVLGILFVVLLLFIRGQSEHMQITILDVGQGSSAYIKTVSGYEILIDSGETNKTLRHLSLIRSVWDRHIDMLIASHSDRDHIGMFPDIIRRYVIGGYVHNKKETMAEPHYTIVQLLKEKNIPELYFEPGIRIEISSETYMTFLHPEPEDVQELSDNDGSFVILLEYKEVTFLFMGDVSERIEKSLIEKYGPLLDIDVLIVGHHGSKTSTSDEFLRYTTPTYAVISSGSDNRHGHPHASVIDRLNKYGAHVLRTDMIGNIQFLLYRDGTFDIMSI